MRGFLGAALICATATLAHSQETTVSTARGEVALDAVPETVVTLDLAILDILDALEVPVAGVTAGFKPAYLSAYAEAPYAQLGSPFEPDIEKLAALSPDLVIVAGRSSTKYDEVAAMAPTIDLTTDATQLVASLTRNMTTLGGLFDKQDEAAGLLAGLEEKFASVRERAADAGTALVILTTGGRMSTHGAQGRFATIFNEMGFTPALEQVKAGTHGQPISNEFILETNPDWIFVVDRDAAIGRDGQPAEQMLDNPLVRRTTAWQKGQVVFLDAADWYLVGAGPRALDRALSQISSELED
ncbi:iron complex transport system substrate-binding protein [Lutimaribacter pacificus]|uniref:Iron complex transport system substrate-binding protein n=1 Tax=Lutimaribacter pacificus TaxID=391948 RepID=A0A1H0BYU5_9RHOB|nr:siderophore ABC transporter substrate-binding protein [Lutimaribacter pacificus]SDN50767.1 iron complex transport system substrate-binding protein [Lutimaribacter pacificus]SHJ50817.1 iron complex transport system substrate-binding protein [Lutimaribacter pacificus]